MRISDWSSDVCSSDLSYCAGRADAARILRPVLIEFGVIADNTDEGAFDDTVASGLPARKAGVQEDYLAWRDQPDRSEERRVGKEGVSTCRSRWSPYH